MSSRGVLRLLREASASSLVSLRRMPRAPSVACLAALGVPAFCNAPSPPRSAFPRNRFGSFAKFAAMRRASSLVSNLAAECRPRLLLEVKALTWRPRRAANAPQDRSRCVAGNEAHLQRRAGEPRAPSPASHTRRRPGAVLRGAVADRPRHSRTGREGVQRSNANSAFWAEAAVILPTKSSRRGGVEGQVNLIRRPRLVSPQLAESNQ
jgi:hypothetical protein